MPQFPLHRSMLRASRYWQNTVCCSLQSRGSNPSKGCVDHRSERQSSNRHSPLQHLRGEYPIQGRHRHLAGERESQKHPPGPYPTGSDEIRLKDEKRRKDIMDKPGCPPEYPPAVDPTYLETYKHYQAKQRAVSGPTTLILVDEADRLHMNSLNRCDRSSIKVPPVWC
jgi:hypothetical protein